MPRKPSPSADQAAKKKKQQVIVGFLLVGLLVAILTQPGDETDDSTTSATPASQTGIAGNASDKTKETVREEIVTTKNDLDRMELDQILATNLFYTPKPEPKPESEESKAVKTEKVTVKAIYGSGTLTGRAEPSGHSVLIGDAIYQAGRDLPGGRPITSVAPNGVTLGN